MAARPPSGQRAARGVEVPGVLLERAASRNVPAEVVAKRLGGVVFSLLNGECIS